MGILANFGRMKPTNSTLTDRQTEIMVPLPRTTVFQSEYSVRRCGWLTLLPIFLCTLSGCLWPEEVERSSFIKRLQEKTISPDHALIEIAILECPIRDEYINEQIWKRVDELIVADSDRRGALNENGFRIGQLVGPMPSELQQKLLDKQCCANPRAMIFPANQTLPIMLGSLLPQSAYDIVRQKLRTEISLDQVRYGLDVSAQFTTDGKTKLTFTPKVENGEAMLPFEAMPDQQRWEMRTGRACLRYPELSWEVTLGPNQYFIAGTRIERERTLGQASFIHIGGEASVQRLLVIRNCRSVTAQDAHQKSIEELVRADKAPPLAVQATLPVTRAKLR
jgi:hypothetical protein